MILPYLSIKGIHSIRSDLIVIIISITLIISCNTYHGLTYFTHENTCYNPTVLKLDFCDNYFLVLPRRDLNSRH